MLKEEIEKTSSYCTKFKDDINKKLEHKSICQRDEDKILYKRIDLLEKKNNCLRSNIKNQQFIIQMLKSNEIGKT